MTYDMTHKKKQWTVYRATCRRHDMKLAPRLLPEYNIQIRRSLSMSEMRTKDNNRLIHLQAANFRFVWVLTICGVYYRISSF